MRNQDRSEATPRVLTIGPVALAGVVLAVRAIRRRSYTSVLWAVGLFGVEAGFRPYRRLLTRGALRHSSSEPESHESRDPDTEQSGASDVD